MSILTGAASAFIPQKGIYRDTTYITGQSGNQV
jgi:hypothetical protein